MNVWYFLLCWCLLANLPPSYLDLIPDSLDLPRPPPPTITPEFEKLPSQYCSIEEGLLQGVSFGWCRPGKLKLCESTCIKVTPFQLPRVIFY